MSKRILVISTSLREKSNSQALGDAFAAGAREAGHQVEQISLRGRSPCGEDPSPSARAVWPVKAPASV